MMTIKLTGLESDLKIQQQVLASDAYCNNIYLLCISEPVFIACGLQKNSSLEKQLEDSDHNSKKVRKRKVWYPKIPGLSHLLQIGLPIAWYGMLLNC